MVQGTERKTYPRVPARNWWDLRRRFIQTPPREVNVGYLQTVLGLNEGAARNLLPSLKAVGLLEETGKPTQRATDWRDDELYPKVCREILQELYPQALLDALPPPNPERTQTERWFARETGTGEASAQKMAAFYILLCAAEPAAAQRSTEAQPTRPEPRAPSKGGGQAQPPRPKKRDNVGGERESPEELKPPTPRGGQEPTVHLDIQIHIDPAASPEQIDQIFASMARHLYRKE